MGVALYISQVWLDCRTLFVIPPMDFVIKWFVISRSHGKNNTCQEARYPRPVEKPRDSASGVERTWSFKFDKITNLLMQNSVGPKEI